MNDVGARAVSVYGGYVGEFRFVHQARWRRVEMNGVAQIYASEFEAETMAWRALKEHMFGLIRSSGHHATHARSEAEKLFKTVFVKNRQVSVAEATP